MTSVDPARHPRDEGADLDPSRAQLADDALNVLLSAELEPIVDMVLVRRDGGYEALAHTGRVRFRREPDGTYATVEIEGRDPFANQSTAPFSPLSAETAHKHPHRSENSYPHAYDHTAQLFDNAAAPDLCVIHSAGHNWEDAGGHLGEHGSLGIIQARAPFVIAGKGVARNGLTPQSARLVDIAPTISELIGARPLDGGEQYVNYQDGAVRHDLLDPASGRPKHVFGFLFDGTNANVLYAMARSGEAPNVQRLIDMGTGLEHGAIASLPTITLANHTTVLTGAHPGHHGILNNAWFDRRSGEQVITNSSATWHVAMESAAPGIESIHSAVHRSFDGAFTASVNEPCDIDADYSTFGFFRRASRGAGEVPPIPSDPNGLPHTTERFVRPSKDYSWSSVIDHMGMEQAVGILSGDYRGERFPVPKFMFCNFTLTDSAMHEGGPHSEMAAASVRDSDARLGEILTAIERTGAFDDSAFFLCADHGMEETDRTVRGDWDVALRDAGVPLRDEAYGFLYLGEAP
jgi:phosphonoacetate hydrolase